MTVSKDSSAPLVAIVGATGNQGGSILQALKESGEKYRIRTATRDVTKASAKALEAQGVEVTQANLSAENKDELRKFFQGATYGFVSLVLL